MKVSARRNKPPEPPADTYDFTLKNMCQRDAAELMALLDLLPAIRGSWHHQLLEKLKRIGITDERDTYGAVSLRPGEEGKITYLRFCEKKNPWNRK